MSWDYRPSKEESQIYFSVNLNPNFTGNFIRGLKPIDFDIHETAFRFPKALSTALEYLVFINMGSPWESKTFTYRLLYG